MLLVATLRMEISAFPTHHQILGFYAAVSDPLGVHESNHIHIRCAVRLDVVCG